MVKVIKKEGIEKPRIVHNKKLFWTIIVLGIILIVLIVFIIINSQKSNNSNNSLNNTQNECSKDSDCVPFGCCHPDSCGSIDKKPICKGILCTEECSGPLDCSAGHCGCINHKCIIINNSQ